ncbi:MAG: hypothetical protein B6I31_02740 [Desulfobacteraceae bacterium 4572_19]|nr:MAG: hypothetical protein B6I31_02740 [Desulfobacteraceae bacterium 4572_19]
MIGELKPHLVWFPALWPETYSYTLSESLKVALPIVAPDIGSFAERLAGRPFSWIVPWDQSVSQRLDLFLSIREELLSIDDISTNGKWVQDPEKKLREFSYSKHYLVPSDSKPQSEKNQPEKNQIDAQWIRKYSNRIEKKENYSCNKQHKPLINFFTKVKENKIGSKIMDYLPEKLKLAVKKRIIPNNK